MGIFERVLLFRKKNCFCENALLMAKGRGKVKIEKEREKIKRKKKRGKRAISQSSR